MNYFVHESSYVDEDVLIGEGTKIWHFCHIQSGARIGKNCSLGQNVTAKDVSLALLKLLSVKGGVGGRGVLRSQLCVYQ